MTIQIDEQIYNHIATQFDKQKISHFVENLFKNLLLLNQTPVQQTSVIDELEQGYQAMAKDSEREKEAKAWINGLIKG